MVAQSTAADVKVNLALNALKDAPPVVALPVPGAIIPHSERDLLQLQECGAIIDSSTLRLPATYATRPLVQFMRSDFKWVMQALGDSFFETLAKAFANVSEAPLDAVVAAKKCYSILRVRVLRHFALLVGSESSIRRSTSDAAATG